MTHSCAKNDKFIISSHESMAWLSNLLTTKRKMSHHKEKRQRKARSEHAAVPWVHIFCQIFWISVPFLFKSYSAQIKYCAMLTTSSAHVISITNCYNGLNFWRKNPPNNLSKIEKNSSYIWISRNFGRTYGEQKVDVFDMFVKIYSLHIPTYIPHCHIPLFGSSSERFGIDAHVFRFWLIVLQVPYSSKLSGLQKSGPIFQSTISIFRFWKP